MALFDSSKYEFRHIVLSLGPSCRPETHGTLASQLPLEWWDCSYVSFPGGSVVKNLPAKQETQVRSLSREDPLEKEMATHSRILAWETSWTEEPGRLQFMGSQRVGYDSATKQQQQPLMQFMFPLHWLEMPLWLYNKSPFVLGLFLDSPWFFVNQSTNWFTNSFTASSYDDFRHRKE